MPKLQRLKVRFTEQYGLAPVGIKHLSGITELSVTNGEYSAEDSNRSVSQSALRNSMDIHPCHPAADIKRCGNS